MPVREVFVDTAALPALINADDSLHDAARSVHEQLRSESRTLVLSDWVLAEFLNASARQPLRSAAIRTVQRLQRSARSTIIPAERRVWERTFELYATRLDKQWSFIDCTTILLCQERSIDEVFSSDKHFVQAGFQILL